MFSTAAQRSSSPSLLQFHRLLLPKHSRLFPNYPRHVPRLLLYRVVPKEFAVCSSLSSVFVSANLIAAAAAAGTSSVHGAVSSTITQVAVTAVAIASGACLSTKVDFLWPKQEEQPGALIIEGVDVTGCVLFDDEKVQKAIEFSKKAHHGQFRKTGEPYLTHCIHTGRILTMLVPQSGQRAIDTVVAGILHDVVDDTYANVRIIEQEFGEEVAKLVAGVSRLSFINQLLRRHRRVNLNQENFNNEADNLRGMLLGMVDDPRVVLIKLADRLHNMRTIYALSEDRAQAVAHETLLIWCSLASRLGLWAMKAELEDLCFAVLQPELFENMRSDLASMWSSRSRPGFPKRAFAKSCSQLLNEFENSRKEEKTHGVDQCILTMKDLLDAVVPFDVMLDRKKRSEFLRTINKTVKNHETPKVLQDVGIALASLALCEEELQKEFLISTSYVPGMEVTLSSRLKSLYSIYCKMKRKDINIFEVYDARALRVVVGDKNGTLKGPAIQCCYNLLYVVHRLWTPIDGQFDDYIVNPKLSGYQSLHTAVQGPDSAPLEVQIRTNNMHEYAEHGHAAHWLYKESGSKLFTDQTNQTIHESSGLESINLVDNCDVSKYKSIKEGHPVLRVEGSHLLTAVITRVSNCRRELLVAVSFSLPAFETVADRVASSQVKRWEAYARLYKKVSDEWWFEPGHGDWSTNLEKYVLCRDGLYHKQDQFQRVLPTFIQIIDLTDNETTEYWNVVSAVFEGKKIDSVSEKASFTSAALTSVEAGIHNKVRLLRTMLQWEEQLRMKSSKVEPKSEVEEVVIVSWPHGEIIRLSRGSTAADAARRMGVEGQLVFVNGQLALPHSLLKDGDVVEFRG